MKTLDYQARLKKFKKRRNIAIALIALILTLVILLISLVVKAVTGNKDNSSSSSQSQSSETSSNDTSSAMSENTSSAASEVAISTPSEPILKEVPDDSLVANQEGFFSQTAFIGDSRTEGLQTYAGAPGATFYTSKGLMVDTIFTKTATQNAAGEPCTIFDAIKENQYKKIYVMLGVNELGWVSSDIFISRYGAVVDELKASQPNATIYIQSILPVSQEKSNTHGYINNPKIESYNALIQEMCTQKGVTYLNVGEVLKDDTNSLFPEASTDGVHLNKDYCLVWRNYLETH